MSETSIAYKKAVDLFIDEFIKPAIKNTFMELEHIQYYQERFNEYIEKYFE